DITRVMRGSTTDVQPVFDAIVRSGVRLCDATACSVFRFDGETLSLVARSDAALPGAEPPIRPGEPIPLSRALASARAIMERGVIHVPDTEADPEFSSTREFA